MRGVKPVIETFEAEVAASSIKYYAVKGGTDENEVVVATANSRNYGLAIDNAPNAGEDLPVVIGGTCLAIAGGTVDKDSFLKSDANGKLVEIDETAGGDPQEVTGRALKDAVSGDVFPIEVLKFVYTPAPAESS